MTAHAEAFRLVKSTSFPYKFRFPSEAEALDQDEEWFEVELDGEWERLRVHDYAILYNNPGLYEALVYDALKCRSPLRLAQLFKQTLHNWPTNPADLRVLDVGAGNGIVGKRLREIGVSRIVGVDIIPEAERAARRDFPEVYDDYLTLDLTAMSPEEEQRLVSAKLNCLTIVAALGFNDIPPRAFANAFNLIENPGWIAFTIKEDFLEEQSDRGFANLMRNLTKTGAINIEAQLRIAHRESLAGEPLFYMGIVARKLHDASEELIKAAE